MDTNKVWGIILIVVGVILALWGLLSVYQAYSVGSQMSEITGMLGANNKMMDSMMPSKIPGLVTFVIGVVSAFFGNKLLKKVRA